MVCPAERGGEPYYLHVLRDGVSIYLISIHHIYLSTYLSIYLEQEVLLVWSALLSVVGNPIIYMSCVTEYRSNIRAAWRQCLSKVIRCWVLGGEGGGCGWSILV